ncbi:MAG: DinB family protein [Thermoplasmata archaeon]
MRSELDTIRALYQYNSQVRKKYLAIIWRLPLKERYKARGASYPSLVDIYLHVLDAYRFWFYTVYDRDTNWTEYPLGVRLTRAQAVREEQKIDRFLRATLSKLRPGDLTRRFRVRPSGKERISLRVLLIHMAEEELQHRGEMNALLWQANVEPPVTGFDE